MKKEGQARNRLNKHRISKGAVRNSKDRFLTAQTPEEQTSLTQCEKRLQDISWSSSATGPN
eukprot:4891931-Ditylum_brightwellii.AAC.1